MSSMSNYLENELIDHVLRGQAYTSPGELFLGVMSSANAPSDAGQGTEPTGTWYTRKTFDPAATGANTQFSAATGGNGQSKNQQAISFAALTADDTGIVIRYGGIFDSSVVNGGNLLFWGQFAADKTLETGDVLSFAANSITITLS